MKRIRAIDLINEELPVPIRSQFVPAIRRAYDLVVRFSRETEWLDWSVGRDILGVLRRVAVEYELKKLIDRQNLPLKYVIAPNAMDNCHHLVLFTERCKITISQLKTPRHKPRKAIFRTNYSLEGMQPRLFPYEFWGIDEDINGRYYMILTHGYSGLVPEFISLAVPGPFVKEWLEQVNLLKEPYIIYKDQDEVNIEEPDLLEFKKEVHEVLNNGKATTVS
ncbi:MAG: hypothetical protein M1486_05435 [Gammaproteobacteria bacterium]|nr:hypothetical protein [Gammaproteobacteria bacterium]